MIIHFSPIRSDSDLNLSKTGDILTVNGDILEFTDLPDGGEYPPEAIENDFIVGGVKRINGEIHITIMLPYKNPNAPQSVTFPEPISVAIDGSVALPEGRNAEAEHAVE